MAKHTDKNVIWSKISKTLTGDDYDIYMYCTYISLRASCRYQGDDLSKLEIIYKDVLVCREQGSAVIMSDLNCRTATQPDYIKDNLASKYINIPDNTDIVNLEYIIDYCDHVKMDKTSADDEVSDNGQELLKLCQSNSSVL